MPELHWYYGYPLLWLVMLALVAGLLFFQTPILALSPISSSQRPPHPPVPGVHAFFPCSRVIMDLSYIPQVPIQVLALRKVLNNYTRQ